MCWNFENSMINMFFWNGLASIDAVIAFFLHPPKTLLLFLDQAIFARLKAFITLLNWSCILNFVCFNVHFTCLFAKIWFHIHIHGIFFSTTFSLVCECVSKVNPFCKYSVLIHVKLVAQVDMCVSFFILISMKVFFYFMIFVFDSIFMFAASVLLVCFFSLDFRLFFWALYRFDSLSLKVFFLFFFILTSRIQNLVHGIPSHSKIGHYTTQNQHEQTSIAMCGESEKNK